MKVLFVALLGLMLAAPAALAQEKIEGKVIGTKLTHCAMDGKVGGCAGTLTMQRKGSRTPEELTFDVPLGTPITQGSEVVYLPALRGRTVVITQVASRKERVAKTIEVAK